MFPSGRRPKNRALIRHPLTYAWYSRFCPLHCFASTACWRRRALYRILPVFAQCQGLYLCVRVLTSGHSLHFQKITNQGPCVKLFKFVSGQSATEVMGRIHLCDTFIDVQEMLPDMPKNFFTEDSGSSKGTLLLTESLARALITFQLAYCLFGWHALLAGRLCLAKKR